MVGRIPTTILPPTPRPTGRLGGSICGKSARRDEAYNQPYIKSNIEPINVANNCWNYDLYDFAKNTRYSEASRSRYSARFSSSCNCRYN